LYLTDVNRVKNRKLNTNINDNKKKKNRMNVEEKEMNLGVEE
jgi:hypothetical protein